MMLSQINIPNHTHKIESGPKFRGIKIALIITVVGLALSGCASLEGKFASSTTADVGYFADQTITMLSQADFTFKRNEAVYVREFVDPDSPLEKRLYKIEKDIDKLFETILEYSLNLVVIYETNSDDQARIEAYADYIKVHDEDVLRQLRLPKETWDALVAEVRKQKKFMKAMESAQPILNGTGWYLNETLNELVDAADQLASEMERRIDSRFAEVVRYHDILLDEKYAILAALEQVYRVNIGEKEAQNRLRESRAIRKKGLVPQHELSDDDLAAVGEHLMARLHALHRIGEEIEPEWKLYRAAHQELDGLYDKYMASIRVARVLTMIWVHAHYQMASGKSAPAEWFSAEKAGMTAIKAIF